jgi:sarcosine oxidase subunit gamma
VPEFRLTPAPVASTANLADRGSPADAAISITAVDYALATVMVRKNQAALLSERVRDIFGIELPLVVRRVAAGPVAFAWAGPGHWLAMAHGQDGAAFEARLRACLIGAASVSDQSDARVVVRVSGADARNALAKGLPIDLHPRAFGTGDTAVTMVSHMATHIWQIDAAPTFELAVAHSYVASFLHWLTAAAGLRAMSSDACAGTGGG